MSPRPSQKNLRRDLNLVSRTDPQLQRLHDTCVLVTMTSTRCTSCAPTHTNYSSGTYTMHTSHLYRLMACATLFAFASTACGGCGEDDAPEDMAQSPFDQGTMKGDSGKADIPDTPGDMGMVTPDAAPDMPADNPDSPADTPDMIPPLTEGLGELGWMVARSQVGDRPMFAELYGDQGPVLFLLSAIHGNERIAISFGERVRTALLGGMAERLGVRIFFVQVGNPDGVDRASRANARGVDLNRNFPAENFDPNGAGGSMPLSES
jgi:hypothetical protein